MQPWGGLWFMFTGKLPHVGPTRMYIKRRDGSREELDMSRWFKFKSWKDVNRFDAMRWTDHSIARTCEFVASKLNTTGQLEANVTGFEVVRTWWDVLPNGRLREGSIQESVYQIDFHD